ncbi:hypothetical protein Lal_00010039 [Lupinus albus]|nr:hypothetical protein Lal_00010039 [Lupinus albus]
MKAPPKNLMIALGLTRLRDRDGNPPGILLRAMTDPIPDLFKVIIRRLAVGPGEFDGLIAIPLPVGSVLVLNGNGADIAKHCVPAVPMKRISITFRRMDESKRPIDHVPEPHLQGIQPLVYEVEREKWSTGPRAVAGLMQWNLQLEVIDSSSLTS